MVKGILGPVTQLVEEEGDIQRWLQDVASKVN